MTEDVLAANEAFYQAFNDRDFQAMESLWSSESPVYCIHPGWRPLAGREQVLESWKAILGNPMQSKIFAGGFNVSLFEAVAVVTCTELVAGNPMAATNVFVNEAGEWKMVHHHSGPVAVPQG